MNAFSHQPGHSQRFDVLLASSNERSLDQFASFHGNHTQVSQLSAGHFGANALSIDCGGISIRLDRCNRTIEREITCGDDVLTFYVCADETPPQMSNSGISQAKDCVFVLPPRANTVLISTASSILLTAQMSYKLFLQRMSSMPDIVDWIKRLNGNGEYLKSNLIADRLRDVGYTALEFSESDFWLRNPGVVEKHLVLSLVTGCTLQWLPENAFSTYQQPRALKRFQAARSIIQENPEVLNDGDPSGISSLGSRRSIEKAFSAMIEMGPVMYGRVLRLNRARRKFRDRSLSEQSIGDIAAEEGFWDWSRFTSYYRKLFGELPSETRNSPARLKACA
ncbi:MAG: helix-turn-helix domain-containing protein [Pseudomonadota bacterium]